MLTEDGDAVPLGTTFTNEKVAVQFDTNMLKSTVSFSYWIRQVKYKDFISLCSSSPKFLRRYRKASNVIFPYREALQITVLNPTENSSQELKEASIA